MLLPARGSNFMRGREMQIGNVEVPRFPDWRLLTVYARHTGPAGANVDLTGARIPRYSSWEAAALKKIPINAVITSFN
jgi:hypothetical protein